MATMISQHTALRRCGWLAALAALLLAPGARAGTLHVPGDYATVQAAIDGAAAGDTIMVAAGTYREAIGWSGKDLTLQGAGAGLTIVDPSTANGGPGGRCIATSGVTSATRIRGFTFQNGNLAGQNGGGMYNINNSSPTVINCAFIGNTARFRGGGVGNDSNCSPTLINCTIAGNYAGQAGGGIDCVNTSTATLINCTIVGNRTEFGINTGISNLANSSQTLTNCIVWDNSISANTTITFSDVQALSNATPDANGNFGADPLFVDASQGNLRLRSNSPCIDRGSDAAIQATGVTEDQDGNPRISPFSVDLGAFEYQKVTPAAPTGLNATVVSETEIDLSWTHDGANTTRFDVYHKPQGGSYSLAGSTPNASTLTFQDTGLTPGTPYTYFVRAVGELNADSAETSKATPAVPTAPANLQTAVFPGARIRLTWEESDANAKEFHLERKTDGNPYSQIALLGSSVRQYYDETVAAGTHYTYRVRAFGITLYSDYSTEAEATTPAPPAAPTGLAAQPLFSTEVKLTWTPADGTAPYQYRIERQSGGGSFAEVGQARGNATAFIDRILTPETTYTYRVRAAAFGAFSDYSNTVDTLTQPAAIAPTALTADPVSATQVLLTWTSGGGTITYFRIERFISGSWVAVGRARPTETRYLDGGLTPETLYQYQVRAVNGAAVSSPSPEADATTKAVPEAPTALTAKALSRGRLQLTWTPGAGTPTAFQIERQDGGSWIVIGKAKPNVTSFIDTGRTAGTFYNYRVRALSGTASSGPSPEAGDTAKP
jgi:fibronectin type 3 domain-containing protein